MIQKKNENGSVRVNSNVYVDIAGTAASNCIGCGKCAKLCPLNNIKLTDKKPVWGNQCTHCMACIGNCPVEAIEYGTITQEKRPYNFGKYRYVVENLKK